MPTFSSEENFVLLDGSSNVCLQKLGPHTDERVSPCSTFKIALSLMGYEAGILIDEQTPTWDFQEGYDDFLEVWKHPQTPKSWMKHSCVWYSRLLAEQLGPDLFEHYLNAFDYGNQDASGGLTRAWLSSSLKISAEEQVAFIQNMLCHSTHAMQMTKELLFLEEGVDGWKLFGKTGWGRSGEKEIGWFVGWIEKEEAFFPFAYHIRDATIDLAQRIPRVKQLLKESALMESHTIVQRPAMQLIGIACRTSNTPETGERDIPELWERLSSEEIINQIPNKTAHQVLGLYCDYEGDHTQPYTLVVGCPVSSLDHIPDGMVGKQIPGGSYALFKAVGEHPQTLIETWEHIWQQSDLKRTYTGDYELYTEKFFSVSPPEIDLYIAIEESS